MDGVNIDVLRKLASTNTLSHTERPAGDGVCDGIKNASTVHTQAGTVAFFVRSNYKPVFDVAAYNFY